MKKITGALLILPLALGAVSASGMSYLPSLSSVRNTLAPLITPHNLERLSNIAALGTVASAGAACFGFGTGHFRFSGGCASLALACGVGSFMSHQLASYLKNARNVTPTKNKHTKTSEKGYKRLTKVVDHISPAVQPPMATSPEIHYIAPDDMKMLTWYENYINGNSTLKLIPDDTFKSCSDIADVLTLLQQLYPTLHQKFKNVSEQHVKKICEQIEQDYQTLTPQQVHEKNSPFSIWEKSPASRLLRKHQLIVDKYLENKEKDLFNKKIAEIEHDLQQNMPLDAVIKKYTTQLRNLHNYWPSGPWIDLDLYINNLPAQEASRKQKKFIANIITWLTAYGNGTAQIKDCPVSAEQLDKIFPDLLKDNGSSLQKTQIRERLIQDSKKSISKLSLQFEPQFKLIDDPFAPLLKVINKHMLSDAELKSLNKQYHQQCVNLVATQYQTTIAWLKQYASNTSTLTECPLAPQQLEKAIERLSKYNINDYLEKPIIAALQTKIIDNIKDNLSKQPIPMNTLSSMLEKALQSNAVLSVLYKSPHILSTQQKTFLQTIALTKQYDDLIAWLMSYATGTSTLAQCPLSSQTLEKVLVTLGTHDMLDKSLIAVLQTCIIDEIQSRASQNLKLTLQDILSANAFLNVLYTSPYILSDQQRLSLQNMRTMQLTGEIELMNVITLDNGWSSDKSAQLEKIKDLIKQGENPYHKDRSGSTAFDLACGDKKIIAILTTTAHTPVLAPPQQSPQTTRISPLNSISYTPHHLQTVSQAYLSHFSPPLAQHTKAHKIERAAQARVLPLHILLPREMLYTLPHNSSEHQGKYHVFYHAHQAAYRVYQDFMMHLLSFETQKTHTDFIPLRFWHQALPKTDALNYLETSGILSRTKNDSYPEIYLSLLAANVSLFGNLQRPGESTLAYYLYNRSIKEVDLHQTLSTAFDFYDFKKDYVKKLNDLLSTSYMRNCGSMLQIFIPRTQVDTTAYLAQPWGYAYPDDLSVGGFGTITTKTEGRNYSIQARISPVLDAIQNGKLMQQSNDMLSELQARIVLGKDVMLNPESGVKIFRIDNLPALKRAWYQQQIQQISHEIFIDWLERVRDNNVRNVVLECIKDTPLGKLVKDRDAQTINALIEDLRNQSGNSSMPQPVSHL